jgi:hypothetical protein
MPPLSRLTLPVFESLVAQLRYAPKDAVRRAIERGEQLASQVEAAGEYPNEWVVYWITRYRPEGTSAGGAGSVKGSELLGQVSAFVEHLCDVAELGESDLAASGEPKHSKAAEFATPDELALRWNVSRKTVDRCRSKGLVGRRIKGDKGRVHVVINVGAAELFRQRHLSKLSKAAGYTRMDDATIARIVRRAGIYRAKFGWSLNQTARRLSERFERSHEAIRQILKKHDAAGRIKAPRIAPKPAGTATTNATKPTQRANAASEKRSRTPRKPRIPAQAGPARTTSAHPEQTAPSAADAGRPKLPGGRIFDEPAPMTRRERAIAWRALRWAIEPARIAERLGHSKAAITRGALMERLDRLRGIVSELDGHESPMFERPEAEQVFLQLPAVRRDLFRMHEPDLGSFLATHRARVVAVGAEESARAIAYHFLLWRARRAIPRVSHLHPSAVEIDSIETDLRWASRLRAILVRGQFPLMIQTLEGRLGVGLHTLRPADTAGFLRVCIAATGEAVHGFDPIRAGASGARVAGGVSPIITKLAAQWARSVVDPAAKGRASAVYSLSTAMDDWTVSMSPWQAWLEPSHRVRTAAIAMKDGHGEFLRDRFGWGPLGPLTLGQLAIARKLTAMRIGALEREAIRAAWVHIRT